MAALTEDRFRSNLLADCKSYVRPLAATQVVYQGAIIVQESGADYVSVGATATGQIVLGVASAPVNSTGKADGDLLVPIETGTFGFFDNSAAADEITAEHIRRACYLVNDNTVAATDGGATRSRAGTVFDVADDGTVIVRFDEEVTP